jgi:hypothetical protein
MHNARSIEATFGLRQHVDNASRLKFPTIFFFFFSSQLGAYFEIYQDITRSSQSKLMPVIGFKSNSSLVFYHNGALPGYNHCFMLLPSE